MNFDVFEMWDAMKETKYRHTLQQLEKKLDEVEGSLDTAIAEALKLACNAAHAEAGSFWYYDYFGDRLIRPRAVYGGSNIGNIVLKPGEGIAGSVIEKGEPMIVKDCAAEPKWNRRADSKSGFTTKSMICVPILLNGQGIGCIQLLNKTDGSLFDEKDLEFETQFAKAISQQFESRGLFAAGYVDENVVVLFAGIHGYMELCRTMMPQHAAQMLSDVFSFISSHVQKHEGIMDRHLSDRIMAYWCSASQGTDAPYRAYYAAQDLLQDAAQLAASLKEKYGCTPALSVGVHLGPAFVGKVGSDAFEERTVIGDTVNMAGALQKEAAESEIFVSGTLLERIQDEAQAEEVLQRKDGSLIHKDMRIFKVNNL